MTSSPPDHDLEWLPPSSARGFSLAGLVLFAPYINIVLRPLFPVRLLNPSWQLSVGRP